MTRARPAIRPARHTAADQPVRSVAEDLLGRGEFAVAIAEAMRGWEVPESLVVALTGPWGSGKSSIKNFIVEELANNGSDQAPDIVPFVPWDIAESGSVANRLLDEIAAMLRVDDKSKRDRERAEKFEQWTAALKLVDTLPERGPDLLKAALLLACLGGYGAWASPSGSLFALSAKLVSGGALVAATVLQASSTVSARVAAFFRARSQRRQQTLHSLKERLREAMTTRERKIVVVIDEIDRLPYHEIQALLRVVRTNADFPNLVFLLVFERTVVEQAIMDQAHVNGAEYLEKIIQLPFTIPQTDPLRVHKVLFRHLDETLAGVPSRIDFDQRRWGNLFHGGLSHYITNLRDVYRYSAAIDFAFGLFRTQDTIEVNQVDLLGLEGLRVFEPALHAALPEYRQLLLQGPQWSGRNDRDAAKKELDNLLLHVAEDRRPAARQILVSIFQAVEWLELNYGFGSGFEEGWERSLRACSSRHFDRYFLFRLRDSEVSEADVSAILAAIGNRDALVQGFLRLRGRGLLEDMLDRLEAYKETIDIAAAVPFVTALMDISDGLASRGGMYDLGPTMHAQRLVFWVLRRLRDAAARAEALRTALNDTVGLQLAVDVIRSEHRREGSSRSETDYLVSEQDLPKFQELGAEKLRVAAATGVLVDHSDLASLLFRWREWAGDEEPQEWVRAIVDTETGAIKLVRAFAQTTYSHGMHDRVATSSLKVSLEALENFIPASVLEARLPTNLDTASGGDRAAVNAFREAIHRQQSGEEED